MRRYELGLFGLIVLVTIFLLITALGLKVAENSDSVVASARAQTQLTAEMTVTPNLVAAVATSFSPTNASIPTSTVIPTVVPSKAASSTATLVAIVPSPTYTSLPSATPTITPKPPSATATYTHSPIPPTATLTVTPTVPTATPVTYIIQTGDDLVKIAQKYSVSMDKLAFVNGITDTNHILIGQALIIPITATSEPTATPTITPTPQPITPGTPTITATTDPNVTTTAVSDLPTFAAPTPANLYLQPATVNGISNERFILFSDDVIQNIRAIYARGKALGRNPHAFSKLGDSTIENPHFLVRFDAGNGPYNLGPYGYLQSVINYYQGSFSRQGITTKRGMRTSSEFDPLWDDPKICGPDEGPLYCEIRVNNPSVMILRIGSNEVGAPELFNKNLRKIVEYLIGQGIVPIMATKADRHEGSNINNEMIKKIAEDYKLPLWDFDLIAGTIPGRGLYSDGVHLTTFYLHDWRLALAYTTGHGVHSITGLMALDTIWRIITPPEMLTPTPKPITPTVTFNPTNTSTGTHQPTGTPGPTNTAAK